MVSLTEAPISDSLTNFSVAMIFSVPGKRFPPIRGLYLLVGPPAHVRQKWPDPQHLSLPCNYIQLLCLVEEHEKVLFPHADLDVFRTVAQEMLPVT